MAGSNPDREGDAKERAPKPPSQMKLVIVAAIALFVAVLGAQVAAPLINNIIAGHSGAQETAADEDALAEEEDIDLALAEPEDEHPPEPALYVALDPPFVVSFDEEGGARYVQLTLQAMARNAKTISSIKQHSPAIRNAFLFLLSSQRLEELTTVQGKEQLRAAMLSAANDVMAKEGADGSIEELYFTSFVIQ